MLIETNADASAYQVAETYALRKDPDRMFEWLDRALTNRDPGLNQILWDAFFVPTKTIRALRRSAERSGFLRRQRRSPKRHAEALLPRSERPMGSDRVIPAPFSL